MRHISETTLNAYLDGLLGETDRNQVENHLRQCPECRIRHQGLELVFSSLAALPDARLARDLTPAILSRLPKKQSLPVLSRVLAVQWGMVLGVSLWGAMQAVNSIKLPSFELWMKLALLELPVLSVSVFQVPSFSMPVLEFPQVSLPTFDLQFSLPQIALVLVSTSLLWLVGNYTLLRHKKQLPS